MRAPELRISSLDQVMVTRAVEDDRRHVVHPPPERLGDRLDVVADRAEEVDVAAGARADGHLPHVGVGERREAARRADSDHRHRAVAAARDDAPPFERVEREVDLLAPGADDRAGREAARVVERAEDDAAADRQDVECRAHAGRRGLLGRVLVVPA